MSLLQLHQSLWLQWEAVSPSELQIWKHASHSNEDKISSFTPHCGQDTTQIKGSIGMFLTLFWSDPQKCWVLHCTHINITLSFALISHENICHWDPLENLSLLISSSAMVCVLKWSMRLNCQMYFQSPTNIIICLDSTLKLLTREDDCKSPI